MQTLKKIPLPNLKQFCFTGWERRSGERTGRGKRERENTNS